MIAHEMVDVLSWDTDCDAPDDLRRRFVGQLSDKFGEAIGRIAREDPLVAHTLVSLNRELPDESLARFLKAPETSHRLLWGDRRDPEKAAAFFLESLTAEAHRAGLHVPLGKECWSALGDYKATPGSRDDQWPAHAGLVPGLAIPLDFSSPHAQAVEVTRAMAGAGGSPATPPVPQGPEEMTPPIDANPLLSPKMTDVASARLHRAMEGIRTILPDAERFVRENTFVLIFRNNPSPTSGLGTSSPEKFIGQSVFWVGQEGSADEADFAEGLIHEAVHSVLDMDDYLSSTSEDRSDHWVASAQLRDGPVADRLPLDRQ